MPSTEHPPQLVVENSSVSFVLMGPGGDHRRVIARSTHDNLDLVGLDNPALAEISAKQGSDIARVFGISGDLQTLVVHTPANMVVGSENEDSRTTHLTFAWKGLARRHDRDKIQEAFKTMAPDIMTAITRNSSEALEWQLAGLILLCGNITNSRTQARRFMIWAGVFMAILYVWIAVTLSYRLR